MSDSFFEAGRPQATCVGLYPGGLYHACQHHDTWPRRKCWEQVQVKLSGGGLVQHVWMLLQQPELEQKKREKSGNVENLTLEAPCASTPQAWSISLVGFCLGVARPPAIDNHSNQKHGGSHFCWPCCPWYTLQPYSSFLGSIVVPVF